MQKKHCLSASINHHCGPLLAEDLLTPLFGAALDHRHHSVDCVPVSIDDAVAVRPLAEDLLTLVFGAALN